MKLLKFKLVGVYCEACVKLSAIWLKKINGVTDVKIDLPTGQVEIKTIRDIDFSEIEQIFKGTEYSPAKI